MKKLAAMRAYYARNKQKMLEDKKNYYLANKETIAATKKIHYVKNKAKIVKQNLAYINKRSKEDPVYLLSRRLRSRLALAIKNEYKGGKAIEELGCSIVDLRIYLESKFQEGMSWENYGIKGWHIDHIKPLSSFDLTNNEELKKACHYTNLQPLWWQDNLRKASNAL